MNSSTRGYLNIAERSLWSAHARCLGSDQAERLELLARRVGDERELAVAFPLGSPPRPDAPEHATVGWLKRHDPHVRALRRSHGLKVSTP